MIVVQVGDAVVGNSIAAELVELADGRSFEELLIMACESALSKIQDEVMVHLKQQWPIGADGRSALPGGRIRGQEIHLWYGPENQSVVRLRPIPFAEIEP